MERLNAESEKNDGTLSQRQRDCTDSLTNQKISSCQQKH